ncbi:HNH endonuclease [Marinagarivorans cellulosilyticus]|uniref:5-methylcytosine-specific restriction enzyme A n=1 Tax=Marinagarivorans cellulosilyticus TaxID=2721545 RepID=A0AAN1WIA2_9GAMM|nr:HNH endonuclease [Marinagarivorans cellulosilyticus]BCD98107.1 5-methylcytosine-specific restriction enzyme A [Marinagarivorans cellulosilyticus]
MNRKQFIEANGATCRNWTWSWSFINNEKKIIIFGAWDIRTEGKTTLIFSEDWQFRRGRSQSAYHQSREHIRLIEEEGYDLMTFPMEHSDQNKDRSGIGPAKIGGFTPELTNKKLMKLGVSWYAYDHNLGVDIPEEVSDPQQYFEGSTKKISVNLYERNKKARGVCIMHYGYKCSVCSFNFESVYGSIGKEFIHVHHVVPLSEIKNEYELDPLRDLVPVCPNCHAMIHRTNPPRTVSELKAQITKNTYKGAPS